MTADAFDHALERGLRKRREILGDAWVDQAAEANAFNADFQAFISRYAWHEVWERPGLDPCSRRLIVLATTCALGRWDEFELHCRAALASADPATRLTLDQLKELLLQMAVYAGVPAANTGMRHALNVLRSLGMALPGQTLAASHHPGDGRAASTRGRPALHYTVRDARSGTAASTVVLSHALGCDLSMWDELAVSLAHSYRVVCFDHRGHGLSDSPAEACAMADLVKDANQVLDEVGGGPVIWIGLSLGAMVGLELALTQPYRLAGLVMANACAGYDDTAWAQWQARADTVRSEGMEAVADAAMQRWFTAPFRDAARATVARSRRRLVSTRADGYAALCEALGRWNAQARLAHLSVPLLLVAGAQDQATPPAWSTAIADQVRGARCVALDGAAHLSVIEQPQAFEQAVRAFLAELGNAQSQQPARG